MTGEDASGIVRQALHDFGLHDATVEDLDSVDHCNLKVHTESGAYFLKILSSDCDESHLRSRFRFVDFLREGGLPIPDRVVTSSGLPFSRISMHGSERLATLSHWIEGQPLGDRTNESWIERCGELLGRLHTRSQEFDPPEEFEATVWDEVCAPPDGGWFAEFLVDVPLDPAAREIILRAAARTRSLSARLPKDGRKYGVIHADFHGDNLIFEGRTIWIVDFDDVGWGYFLFDVGWPAMLFSRHHPDKGTFLIPFLRGYERHRPLSGSERELLPDVLLTAGIGGLEMVHSSPIANDAPRAQEWISAIVEWLESHLAATENGERSHD